RIKINQNKLKKFIHKKKKILPIGKKNNMLPTKIIKSKKRHNNKPKQTKVITNYKNIHLK
ncbi:hypothetical protein ACSL0S_22710, partial [Salmonella enterica]|uniref:hypothetical protein n=1 Tax=Salmonella enterica TaxID=28901 RepID=UPI003F199944